MDSAITKILLMAVAAGAAVVVVVVVLVALVMLLLLLLLLPLFSCSKSNFRNISVEQYEKFLYYHVACIIKLILFYVVKQYFSNYP